MRSSRLLFLAFFTFGIFAFGLLSPSKALAEWENVGSTKYLCVTDVQYSSFGTSNLKTSPVHDASVAPVNALVSTSVQTQYGNLSGVSSSTATYVLVPVLGGNIPAKKRFRINMEGFKPFYYTYSAASGGTPNTTINLSISYISYYYNTGSDWRKMQPSSTDGLFSVPYSVQYVAVVFRSSEMANINGYPRVTIGGMGVIVQVPDGEPTVEGYIQDQTEELKSTEGSNNIVDGSQGQQITQNIGFIQQTGQFVTSAFDAVNNAEASSGLNFPGLTIMGYTIIPAQQVAFLGYLGTDLENQIRSFVTLVLFLAWLMGLRGFYRKMFLGETEVEVVDE